MSDIFKELDQVGARTAEAISRFMGDSEMYLGYVKDFPEEPTMKALVKAVSEEDYEQAEASVHALKGIVNNLGFVPLSDATMDMLEELRDKNIEDALDAYEDVKREYKKVCDVIVTWRESN